MLLAGNRMKSKLRIISFTVLIFLSSAAAGSCSEEQIKFSFANISAQTAFSLVADFAGLELSIDKTTKQSQTIKFDCMHWKKAASYMAKEYNVELKIYNGTMYVND